MRILSFIALSLMSIIPATAREVRVYFGTYTKTTSKGIYTAMFDTETGRLGRVYLAAEASNPSFVAVSPDRRFAYAVSEGTGSTYQGKPSGSVGAYAIQPDGELKLINTAATAGKGPCHVSVTPDGKAVLVANYGSGTVALLRVKADGGLEEPTPASVDQHEGKSVNPGRQKGPYAHSINPSPDSRFAFAADLGTDKLYSYHLDTAAGTLAPASPASLTIEPGSGPRHLALAPDSRHAYLINELLNTITVLERDAETGAFKALQTVPTLPSDFEGRNTTAEIAVHPSGRFVYGSNRGHNSIAVFSVNAKSGQLTPIEHVTTQGKNPRHFALDPTGRWLIAANQDSDSLVIYSVDAHTGKLTPTGDTVTLGNPVCVRF